MNTPRILQILCLALAFSFQPSAFPQVQWTATTDTNGNFTWPVQIPSGQVGAFTNDLLLKTTNGIITGHCYSAGGYWLQAGQFITVCSSSGFSVADTNGGFAYTNGIFYVDGVPAANTLQLGSNYLSLSNYTTMQFGTLGTNGTNFTLFVGLGSTNLAYRIGAAATNNTLAVSNLAYVLGANGTNYANQVNAAAQSFAIGLAANATNNLNGASNVLAVVIGAGLAAGTNNLNTASNNLAAVIAAGLAAGTNNLDSASNVLSLLVAGGGLSYLIGNNILLRTPDTQTRFEADESGNLTMQFENGNNFFTADTSHNLIFRDNNGAARLELDDAGNTGANILRGSGGVAGITESANGYVKLVQPETTYTGTWPLQSIGLATNFFADAANVNTSEDSTNAFMVPANTLATNGDMLVRTVGITLATGSSTKEIRLYFAGDNFFDTGSLANTGAGAWSIRAEIIRTSATTYRYNVSAVGSAVATAVFAQVGSKSLPSGDFTSAQDFHVSLTVTGSGAGASQADIITDATIFEPSPTRQFSQ